jgi:hypothetical protein
MIIGFAILPGVAACAPEKTTVRPVAVNYKMTGQDPVGHVQRVVGTIYYGSPNEGEPAIVSDGDGGSCLAVKQNKACEDPSDCTYGPGQVRYCLDKKTIGGHRVGQCWVKGPDKQYCMKSGDDIPGPLEADTLYDVPFKANQPGGEAAIITGPAVVRLITCLNPPRDTWSTGPDGKPARPCGVPGVGGVGALHRFGPPVSIP